MNNLAALDFGFLVFQNAGYGNRESSLASALAGDDNKFDYQANFVPRLSAMIGEQSEFYISAAMSIGMDDYFYFVPELLRTEITLRSGPWGIKAGRMNYQDPLSFIAGGLFDGAQFFYNFPAGNIKAGLWYSGLLYKKTANITMTAGEQLSYDTPLDYGDFAETYFAPRRLLAGLDWEHLSIAELVRLRVSFLSQSDLNSADEKLHSQYLTFKAGLPFKSFLFELGGSVEFAETENFNMAFAWDASVTWTLSGNLPGKLSFAGHFAGGKASDFVDAFVPVTNKYYGNILRPRMSGISVIDLNYTVRIIDTLGATLNALYFVRNDLGAYYGYPVSGDGFFLGPEIYGSVVWSPVSDLQLNLGGGVFLPALGNAGRGGADDEKAQWRVELSLILALY